MILEEGLQQLQVAVKGGGNLVSHRPVFSKDSSKLFIVQSSKVLTYSTATGLLLSKYTTPEANSIANIQSLDDDRLVVFTTTGKLLELDTNSNSLVRSRQVKLHQKGWTPIAAFINFYYPTVSTEDNHFFVLGYPEDASLPVLYGVSNDGHLNLSKLCWEVVPSQHSVAISPNGKFVVAIQRDSLYCKDMNDEKKCRWHSSGTRQFTCVAVHPTLDWVCATGDDSGRVLIWNNVLTQISPAKTVFHWHTLPVSDLAFTPEGSQMVSGGGECTMVKWDVSDTTNKRTLPRMGLPIRHLSVACDGEFVAVAHADNCIQLVDPYNNIVGSVKNFTQCYIPEDESTSGTPSGVFSAGIQIDPNNSCLVMNGRPGWLQCYSFREDKHLYTLDIAQQNYVTAERHKSIPNSEVSHVAFSKNGVWMCAAEARVEPVEEESSKCTELRLKFWKHDKEKQKYVLNTSIDWPHEGPLTGLRIQPISESNEGLIAATGGDSTFKIWGLISDPSIHGKSEWWYCEKTGAYKDLPAGPLGFSSDGSMMAASFGRVVTLWDVTEDCDFKQSLCHQRLTEDIKLLQFGQNICSHLVVCCTTDNLIVWDVITSSLLWVAPVQVASLAVDPLSSLVCTATTNHHLFFFTPDHPQPLAIHKNVSKSRIIAASFVPNHQQMDVAGLKSTLVFLNTSQELCALLPKEFIDEEDGDILKVQGSSADTSALTPYAQMIAEKTVSEVDASRNKWDGQTSSGQKAYSLLRDIMDASPHTMPSVTYFCSQLMRVLSKPSSEGERLAQMEEFVKSTSFAKPKKSKRKKGEKRSKNLNSSDVSNAETSISDNFSSLELNDADLDYVTTQDTSWIDEIFTK